MSDPIDLLAGRLRAVLAMCMGKAPHDLRLLRATDRHAFEWTLVWEGKELDMACFRVQGQGLLAEATFNAPFLGFRVGEEFLWEMVNAGAVPCRIEVEGSLRAAETAAALKSARQTLKQFKKRLAGLEGRMKGFVAVGGGKLSEEMHLLVAGQWQLLHRLQAQKGKWAVHPLAKALEQYGRALTQCWDREQLDVSGDPEQTALHLRIWEVQKAQIAELLAAIQP